MTDINEAAEHEEPEVDDLGEDTDPDGTEVAEGDGEGVGDEPTEPASDLS